jgi:NAD(P)-dependent dehydrogenase (short-subunit alcohol dehydrogenase family)
VTAEPTTDDGTADESDHGTTGERDDEDRVALVTGAASGIGRATAVAFHDAGWTTYATDLPDRIADADLPEGCRRAALDVTDADDRERVVEQVVDETGRFDCLVNNAGYAVPGAVEDVPVEAGREQFDVLVHGPHGLVREALKHMRDAGSGTVVNVTSVLGRTVVPGSGLYCAAKHAAEGLSDALRMELDATGVDVVAVEPAWVDTDFDGTAGDRLDDLERTDAYADIYEPYDAGTSVLDGGPLAVAPERVGETVLRAAEADQPPARLPVGAAAQALAASRYLPDPLQDRVKLTVGRLYSALR